MCEGWCIPYIIEPYSWEFEQTPIGSKQIIIKSHRFREPVSRVRISGEWDTDVIMNAAREAGVTDIYYIDKKTTSFLLDSYRRQTLIVYGE